MSISTDAEVSMARSTISNRNKLPQSLKTFFIVSSSTWKPPFVSEDADPDLGGASDFEDGDKQIIDYYYDKPIKSIL